jgi:hypothetical protein
MDDAYLVMVKVHLVGGQTVCAVDVFRAENESIALNYARNVFIKEKEAGAVTYGDAVFLTDTICALEASVLGIVDLELPGNSRLKGSADVFEEFLAAYEAQK